MHEHLDTRRLQSSPFPSTREHAILLVVHSNVNVLLKPNGRGKHLLLFLALETGQFLHSLLENRESRGNLLFSNDKRRRKADDVLVCGFRLSM
jgi:hypothetical protein